MVETDVPCERCRTPHTLIEGPKFNYEGQNVVSSTYEYKCPDCGHTFSIALATEDTLNRPNVAAGVTPPVAS
jgi:hypothetical protein